MSQVVIDRRTLRLLYDPAVDDGDGWSAEDWAQGVEWAAVWDTEKAGPCFLCGKQPEGVGFVPDAGGTLIPLCHPDQRTRPTCLQRWKRGERPTVKVKALGDGVLAYLDAAGADRVTVVVNQDGDVVLAREVRP